MSSKSDTPRTDEIISRDQDYSKDTALGAMLFHACQLERELAAAKQTLKAETTRRRRHSETIRLLLRETEQRGQRLAEADKESLQLVGIYNHLAMEVGFCTSIDYEPDSMENTPFIRLRRALLKCEKDLQNFHTTLAQSEKEKKP